MRKSILRISLTVVAPLSLLGAVGCATGHGQGPAAPAVDPNAPVTHVEMEPLKIEAVQGEDGLRLEAYDAAELFERAGAALSDKKWDDAVAAYDRLLKEFGDSRFVRPALYNIGLAYQGKKDWQGAADRFKALVDGYPDAPETKDGLFQLGATFAEMANWPASAEVFARILGRADLNADDKIEAYARRGFAQFNLKDLETAERTFSQAITYFHMIEAEERLATDFYVGFCQYHLGQIPHERFRALQMHLPERQMAEDMEQKARLLLAAQRAYVDTIKIKNPAWASASGFQIGSLYEEFYEDFMRAPVPPEMLAKGQEEKREIYYEELRKKIRVLLEKSLRIHEQNLLMAERVGLQNEWRDKSKLAYAKLQKLLDPQNKFEFADPTAPRPAAEPEPAAPPVPVAPAVRSGATALPAGAAPAPSEEAPQPAAPPPGRPKPEAPVQRQIL